MSDVVDRITARLDAMESAARAAHEGDGTWEVYTLPDRGPNRWQMKGVGVTGDDMGHRTETMFTADATHIALNDPAAVLRIVAGLRAVVALHEERHGYDCGECGVLDGPCRTLLAIAAMWPDTDPRTTP